MVQVGQVFSTIGQPEGSLQIHSELALGTSGVKISIPKKISRNIFIAFIDCKSFLLFKNTCPSRRASKVLRGYSTTLQASVSIVSTVLARFVPHEFLRGTRLPSCTSEVMQGLFPCLSLLTYISFPVAPGRTVSELRGLTWVLSLPTPLRNSTGH